MDSITWLSHFKTSGHSFLVFRKVPHRDELFVCLQQPDSIFTAGLYLGAVPWAGHWAGGDLNPCPFCTVSISHNCTYCIAKVSGTALSTREYSTPLGRCVGVIPLLLSRRHHLGVFKSPWPVVLQYIMAGEWIGVIIDYFCVGRAEVFGLLLFRWISCWSLCADSLPELDVSIWMDLQ